MIIKILFQWWKPEKFSNWPWVTQEQMLQAGFRTGWRSVECNETLTIRSHSQEVDHVEGKKKCFNFIQRPELSLVPYLGLVFFSILYGAGDEFKKSFCGARKLLNSGVTVQKSFWRWTRCHMPLISVFRRQSRRRFVSPRPDWSM